MLTGESTDKTWISHEFKSIKGFIVWFSPIKKPSKDNSADAVWDTDDAEKEAALGLAQPPKLDRSVGGEGEKGIDAKVDEELGEEEEQHGGRR